MHYNTIKFHLEGIVFFARRSVYPYQGSLFESCMRLLPRLNSSCGLQRVTRGFWKIRRGHPSDEKATPFCVYLLYIHRARKRGLVCLTRREAPRTSPRTSFDTIITLLLLFFICVRLHFRHNGRFRRVYHGHARQAYY